MMPVESYSRKKKSGIPYTWIFIFAIIAAIAGIYFLAPDLYYRFSGSGIHRIKSRLDTFEDRYIGGNYSNHDLLLFVQESRKIVEQVEEENKALYLVHYYAGLIDFYEFVLRVPLDENSLVNLITRGYLPLEVRIPDVENEREIRQLAYDMASSMRRALALDPDMNEKPAAQLIIAYGELFYTGRTDPYLLDLITPPGDILYRDFIQPEADWLGLAIYTFLGKKREILTLLSQLESQQSTATEGQAVARNPEQGNLTAEQPPPEQTVARMNLSPSGLLIIRSFGYLYARDYMRALITARRVKFDPNTPIALRISATRLEGEVFLIQRGPFYALRYFQQALLLSEGKDEFLQERIDTIKKNAGF